MSGERREGNAWIGYLIMIILGVAGIIAGIIFVAQDACKEKQAACYLLTAGIMLFVTALVEWIAGGVSQAQIGLNGLRVNFGLVPAWAHLVSVVVMVVAALILIFGCPAICP